jgi:tetratricopeptide (TPR) repeat protein
MRAKLFSIFLTLILVAGYIQFKYDSHTNYVADKNVFVTLPSSNTLKVLSFGFQDLVADMLFIWSIQFYGTYNLTNRYDYLEQIYNTITDLAPQYLEPYIVGSWIMALEAKDIEMAIRLLQKGSRNMKNEWIFDYECAFYAYKYLKDYEQAEKYYRKAAQRPNAPSMVKRKQAHMVYMKDDLTQAYAMWKEIYEHAKTRMERDAAFCHLYQIKFDWDKKLLEDKLDQYKARYGRYPMDLSQLVRAGLLRGIPKDFSGFEYTYNPKTGKIMADRVFQWKK